MNWNTNARVLDIKEKLAQEIFSDLDTAIISSSSLTFNSRPRTLILWPQTIIVAAEIKYSVNCKNALYIGKM